MNNQKWVLTVLCTLCFILHAGTAFCQLSTLGFTHFSVNEGLSHSNVYSVVQDHQGFMWFGTLDGLNKFDGYQFTVYKKDPANNASISNNHVAAIREDRFGNLWIATRGGGVNMLDCRRNRFVRYQHKADDPHSLSNDFVSSLAIDSEGYIWAATENGLNRLDPRTKQFTRFLPDATRPGRLNDASVKCVIEDSQRRLWVGTEHGGLSLFDSKTQSFTNFSPQPTAVPFPNSANVTTILEGNAHRLWLGTRGGGLCSFDPVTKQFASYLQPDDAVSNLPYPVILSLEKDKNGRIWIGTENNGLSTFNPDIGVFATYRHDEIDQSSITDNSVYSIYRDIDNNIWLGIYGGGVNLVNRSAHMFTHYKHTSSPTSLNHNTVLAFFEDSYQHMWVGTDGGGVSLFDPARQRFKPYRYDKNEPNSLSGNYVLCINEDSHQNLWIGTWNDGLSVFNRKLNTFKRYRHNPADSASLGSNNVYSLIKDRDKTMWVATWGNGLDRYDETIDGFRHYRHNPTNANTIASNALHHIIQDRRGYIWIATADAGVDRFDPKTQRFAHFTQNDQANSLSNNNVTFLYEDRSGAIWMTTSTGLSCYNPVTNQFTNFFVRDGLPNDVIDGILEDKAGNFWISTNGGLSRFDPRKRTFQNFTVADGLQASEFKQHACLRSRAGLMYFGGTNGFNVFKPSTIQVDNFDPPLLFTNLFILNKEVPVAIGNQSDSPLHAPISETKSLTLPYHSSVVTIEFASLNYTIASKKQYAYCLAGFDNDWNYVGTSRTATYTNLDPGTYQFKVKGKTNRGEWSPRVRTLTLTILSPYWLTWWFKLLVVTAILGGIYLFYRFRIRSISAQKWVLEQVLVERTERLKQEQKLNEMKSQFVSTASHEFRTPLTTIQSSVDLVAMYLEGQVIGSSAGVQKHLAIIGNEINKFSNLLNDVLSIEKMNAGKIVFSPAMADVASIYNEVIASHFQAQKDQRRVEISVSGTPRPVWLDERLISHALTNLLSNAFKYSSKNPALHIDFSDKTLTFSVSDYGIGIPKQDLPHLFETFYRAGNVSSIQGTGLGLFITRQFVDLHGGSVSVDSKEGVGTTFTIVLPAHYQG